MGKHKRIAWHPGFYGGLELDLREYRDILTFEEEHELSKEPLHMDMLIIKKHTDEEIRNEIGRIFRKHNVVEYKSPHDDLSIDVLYKTIGYACLYKGLSKRVNDIPADDISISLFRHRYPRKLFSELKRLGAGVEKKYEGVYYIKGIINIPLQIVITSELRDKEIVALKVLSNEATTKDVERFLDVAKTLKLPGDRENADAVLQVSVSANQKVYDVVREEKDMCEALRELMKDEIDKEVKAGVDKARAESEAEKKAMAEEIARLKEENARLRAVIA